MEEKYLKNLIGLSCKIAANTKSSETFLIVSIREVIRTRIPMLMLMNFRSGVFTSKGLDDIALLPSCKIRLGQRLSNMSAQRSSGNTWAEPEQILTPSAVHPEGKALPVTHAAAAEIDFLDEIIAVSEAEHPGFADAVDAAYQGRGPRAKSTVSPLGEKMADNLKDLMEMIQDNLLVAFDHLSDEEKTVMCQVVVDTINDGRGPWAKSTVSPPEELEQIVQLCKRARPLSVSAQSLSRADLKNWLALDRFIEDLQDKYHFPEPD